MSLIQTSFETATGLPEFVGYIFFFALGAIIGSFLNVVIHRVPNEESIVFPNSACPKCKNPIKPYDNIPILSWLISRRKMPQLQKPDFAALSGGRTFDRACFFVLVFWQIGLNAFLPVALIFAATMVALIFIDAEHMILPDVINYPLLVFALIVRVTFAFLFGAIIFPTSNFFRSMYLQDYPIWLVSLDRRDSRRAGRRRFFVAASARSGNVCAALTRWAWAM